MPKFRKKPVVIEATRLTRPMTVETLEGTMKGNVGDWLITGVKGEQYFCKDDIFKMTYENVSGYHDVEEFYTSETCETCGVIGICPRRITVCPTECDEWVPKTATVD